MGPPKKEWIALMLGLLLASCALHAEERRASRGERLALEGRCEAALPELERELALDDGSASALRAWRLGQCALRLQHYGRAARALERALEADPDLAPAKLDLARARYHTGDLAGADAALGAGEADLSGEALWQLYRGMVHLRLGDAPAAVVALERAVALNATAFRTRSDPEAVEPVASYYLGLALQRAGQEARARDVLRDVSDGWAGTDWAVAADRALGESADRRAWLTLGAGMEYDDNVVLAGRDTPLPRDISDGEDFRGVWLARGGIDFGTWGDTSAGALASYRGRAHVDGDLREFDSHFPTASLWVNQALRSDTHLRLRYDFGYAWVDTDPFLVTNGGRLSLIHAWSARQTTAVHGTLFIDDYRFSSLDVPDGPGSPGDACTGLAPPFTVCGPPGLNERSERDRDGWGAGGGIAHSVTLAVGGPALPDPSLRGGYAYTNFDADGREYSHQAHRVFLGLGVALPWSLGLDLDGSYTNRVHRHPTTFPEQDGLFANRQYGLSARRRREHVYAAGARLTLPLTDALSASAHYQYRDNRSTADVFDYDQHVVGLLFNFTFERAH